MAATKLTYAMPGAIDREAYADLYDATMTTYIKREENVPIVNGQFFSKHTDTPVLGTNGALTVNITTWSDIFGLPRKREDVDPVIFDQPAPGYNKAISVFTFRNGARITETLLKLDRSGHASQLMGGLPASGRRMLEYAMANLINNGTTTAGSDGSFLFAADHYAENVAEGSTWSNLETGAALTPTTYNTMRLNMRKRKGERGFVSPITLKKLVVPADLEQMAKQISGSDKIPTDSLNAINPWKGVSVEVNDYMTSTTAWMGWGDGPESSYGLHYAEFTAPQVKRLDYPNADFPHIVAGWELYMQFGVGGSQVRNAHWNAGA